MEQWEIERRHDEGALPDWMYYQLSDKPAWMKLEEQKKKFLDYLESRQREQQDAKQMEKSLEAALEKVVNREFSRIFEDFRQ
jgi:hypothetical protein